VIAAPLGSGDQKAPEFRPPAAMREIADTLEARGFQAWAVGGAVRDELLGNHRADWDIATDARPDDVRRVFRRTVPIGIEHGTVGVLASDGEMYEVTTFRRDIETDGRHAVVEFSDHIEEDLGRRDFTINALAWRPATDELVDPFAGESDMEASVLRAVGEPSERFAEDYLRVLRGLRFAGRFGLTIELQTEAAMRASVAATSGLSAERVREELTKVLADHTPSTALRLYADFGLAPVWYPELEDAAADPRFELELAAVDAIPARRALLRLARLLAAAGTGETGQAAALSALERLRFSRQDIQRVGHLVEHLATPISPTDSDAQIRGWLAEVGADNARDLFRLHFAAARARGADEQVRFACAAWRRVHETLVAAPPLRLTDLAISGDDLLELGVDQGPSVGVLLDELHALVLEDPEINQRDDLLQRARELIEIGYLGGASPGPPAAEAPRDG